MPRTVKSVKPYNVIAGIIFFVGIGTFAYMGVYDWLPAVTLSLGISVIIRQLLLGFHIDVLVAVIVFGAVFLSSFMQFFARVFLPTFVLLGTVYYIVRQFITFRDKLEVKTSDVHIEPNLDTADEIVSEPVVIAKKPKKKQKVVEK